MNDTFARLQLRHFRLIRAIALEGQLSFAAERLAITQPSASRTLAEIERLVGRPVFERHPKGMSPTAIGDILARHADAILSSLGHAAKEIDAFRAGRSGVVRVGAVTGPAVGFVVPAIQSLKRGSAGAEITLDVAPSRELMDGLLAGSYDFVLSRISPEVDIRALEIVTAATEKLVFLARSDHPLMTGAPLSLRDLAGYGWVIQAPGMPIREAIEGAFVAREIAPPGDILNSSSLLVVMAVLHRSDAIAPVSREVSDLLCETRSERIARLPLAEEIPMPPYHVIHKRGRPLSPVAQALLDLVVQGVPRARTMPALDRVHPLRG